MLMFFKNLFLLFLYLLSATKILFDGDVFCSFFVFGCYFHFGMGWIWKNNGVFINRTRHKNYPVVWQQANPCKSIVLILLFLLLLLLLLAAAIIVVSSVVIIATVVTGAVVTVAAGKIAFDTFITAATVTATVVADDDVTAATVATSVTTAAALMLHFQKCS